MMSPLRSRRVAVLCVILLLVVSGCTDGLLVPDPEGVDDPEPETSLCGTDGNDPCEMEEVVVEEEMPPPPPPTTAHPDPISNPVPNPRDPVDPIDPRDEPIQDGGGPIQTPDPVSKAATRDAFIKRCGLPESVSDGIIDNLFEASARETLSMTRAQNPVHNQPLDGAKFGGFYLDGKPQFDIMSSLLEVKRTEASNPLSYSQSQKHLDALAYYLDLAAERAGGQTVFAPSYWVVSLSSSLTRLDYNSSIQSDANSRGIMIYHARLRFDPDSNEFFLRGEAVGRTFGAPSSTGRFLFVFQCS